MGFFSFFAKKADKYEKFLFDCETVIASYENNSLPSCKNDLIEAVKSITQGAKNEIKNGGIPPSQYFDLINKLLANASFDLLSSGRYHIYRGMLNPMSCATNLMAIHNKSVDYGYKKGLVTEAQKDEDYSYLIECINNVG